MEVKVYSTPTCGYCKLVKEFLSDKGVKYTEFDVSADEEKMQYVVEMTGQMGVPVIEIGGDMVVGFDQEKITELLEGNKSSSKEDHNHSHDETESDHSKEDIGSAG